MLRAKEGSMTITPDFRSVRVSGTWQFVTMVAPRVLARIGASAPDVPNLHVSWEQKEGVLVYVAPGSPLRVALRYSSGGFAYAVLKMLAETGYYYTVPSDVAVHLLAGAECTAIELGSEWYLSAQWCVEESMLQLMLTRPSKAPVFIKVPYGLLRAELPVLAGVLALPPDVHAEIIARAQQGADGLRDYFAGVGFSPPAVPGEF